jgi:hypothetical protein
LSRLKNSTFRGEVIAALSAKADVPSPSPTTTSTTQSQPSQPSQPLQPSPQIINDQLQPRHGRVVGYLDCLQPAYSPLEILAAAVALKRNPIATENASLQTSQQRNDALASSFSQSMQVMPASPESLASEKAVELYFSKHSLSSLDALLADRIGYSASNSRAN